MERFLNRIPNTFNGFIHYEFMAFKTFDKVVLVLLFEGTEFPKYATGR